MTDRIDLDELAGEDEPAEEEGTPGDWLWGDGEPPELEDRPRSGEDAPGDAGDGDSRAAESAETDAGPAETDRPTPHVPRPTRGKPAGIPVEGGGAGGGSPDSGATGGPADPTGGEAAAGEASAAAGPHGGDADEMTLAFTYAAATRLAEPGRAFADAARWADWVGIIGEVDAPVINQFQRDHRIDVDFFSGTGTGPGDRLAEIDERSMFFAARMVVVGLAGRDEPVAERAGWEFVPLAEAAEKADWVLGE